MIINTQKLLTTERKVILSHIMLEDSDKAEQISKTLDGLKGDDRLVDVKVVFNGIEVDGKVMEDWLQYQFESFSKKMKEQYEDIEKEIERRVNEYKKDLECNYKSEVMSKLNSVNELLTRIEVDIECLDI